MNRRDFLKMLSMGAVAASTTRYFDFAPSWKKHEELFVPGGRFWKGDIIDVDGRELTVEDIQEAVLQVEEAALAPIPDSHYIVRYSGFYEMYVPPDKKSWLTNLCI